MKALSRECRIGYPWELLYADDLVIITDNLEDLKIQLHVWRTLLETRGLRINVGKTKILGSSGEAKNATRNVKLPWGVCFKGVGVNSILCQSWTSGFIKDAQELEEHWRKKACLDARSVKVKVPQIIVWISSKYMSVKRHSKRWLENPVVVLMQLVHTSLQHGKVLGHYCQSLPTWYCAKKSG